MKGDCPLSDEAFWRLIATWPAVRDHPNWKDRPEIKAELERIKARFPPNRLVPKDG